MGTSVKKFGTKKTEYLIKRAKPVIPIRDTTDILVSGSMKTVQSVVIKQKSDTKKYLNLGNEYLANKYHTIVDQRISYKGLSKRNAEMLKVLDEIMSQPDDKGEEWWDEYFRDLKNYRFKI